jgi:pyrroline-5-carboxylate reductase
MRRVSILGVGKLGEAIAEGLLASGEIGVLYLVERSEERRQHAARRFRATVTVDPLVACRFSEAIVLAVKPNDLLDLCRQIGPALKPTQSVISAAAGVRLERIQEALGGHSRVARVMPNLAVSRRRAVTGVFSPDLEAKAVGGDLFGLLGKCVLFESEAGIDEMTAVGASAPAFVAEFLDAMISAGEENGLKGAREVVLQMAAGTLEVLAGGKETLAEFVARVRTPGGTTAAGLEKFDEGDLRGILKRAIRASIDRSVALGEEIK